MTDIGIRCIFCHSTIVVDKKFAATNGRVFCPSCCKAFEVVVDYNEYDSDEECDIEDKEDLDYFWDI